MLFWRITKYNPKNRDATGSYCKNEWTSYSDIGTRIDGKDFTYDQYIKTEDAYVTSIILFMKCNNVESLKVINLEKYADLDNSDKHISQAMHKTFDHLRDDIEIEINEVNLVARLILREKLWCKLESKNMFVHFGYDYYMYIGSACLCEQYIKEIQVLGLFVENDMSPYKSI